MVGITKHRVAAIHSIATEAIDTPLKALSVLLVFVAEVMMDRLVIISCNSVCDLCCCRLLLFILGHRLSGVFAFPLSRSVAAGLLWGFLFSQNELVL